MANIKNDNLTLNIGGVSVRGKLTTDLDNGKSEWRPYTIGQVTTFSSIVSEKDSNGNWDWKSNGNFFEDLRNSNSSLKSQYSTANSLSATFYSSTSQGSPISVMNGGRTNQFKVYGAPVTAQRLGVPGSNNTATPPPQTQPGSGGNGAPTDPPYDLFDENNRITLKDADDVRKDYKGPDNDNRWIYPTNLGENGQDFIMFNIIQYQPRNFTLFKGDKGSLLTERERNTPIKDILGTICLPIQPSITDLNSVDWNREGINPLQLGVTQFAASLIEGNSNIGENVIDYIAKGTKDANTVKAIKLAIAQKAASTEGLLSRVAGAIVNPNLELLFQGVQLRPFNFTFRLSPRDKKEAYRVRGIIRAFKEAMAAKNSQSSLFLKAPNVFEIKYVTPGKENHPSLNRIKTCALQSCSVDYTPDGSYMTFNDGAKTMTSYSLTLQFQELEPITSKDYTDITDTAEIGY